MLYIPNFSRQLRKWFHALRLIPRLIYGLCLHLTVLYGVLLIFDRQRPLNTFQLRSCKYLQRIKPQDMHQLNFSKLVVHTLDSTATFCRTHGDPLMGGIGGRKPFGLYEPPAILIWSYQIVISMNPQPCTCLFALLAVIQATTILFQLFKMPTIYSEINWNVCSQANFFFDRVSHNDL